MSDFPRFRGGFVLAVDAKSRVTVPAKHVESLQGFCGGKMVICKNPDGCLNLYPLPVWEKFEAHLNDLPATTGDDIEDWKRIYIGSATDVQIDSASRVLLPHELRPWAGIEPGEGKECRVRLIGVGSYFELWDIARNEERENAAIAKGRPAQVVAVKL